MAESFKNQTNSSSLNASKINSTVSEMTDKVSDVAHDVVSTFQENRTLMYAGIGVLVAAAGLGIWALVRQFSSDEESSEGLSSSKSDTFYKGREY